MEKTKTVDAFILANPQWEDALNVLRSILLETELEESIKWGAPNYSIAGKNVVGLGAFKSYVGLWFYQGVFLKDPAKKLLNAQEGKTKAMRQWRFATIEEIDPNLIKQYVLEAIANSRAGKEVEVERNKLIVLDPIFKAALDENPELQAAFKSLSPGKQREYAEYISEAKQEATKQRRIQKSIPIILSGLGLHDKYKKN
ncbi:MAG: YdeI/OmpD-associated family protein [Saprospiraceae bacterium]